MVQRFDNEEDKPVKKAKKKVEPIVEEVVEEKVEEETEERKIPMLPNYLEIIANEVIAIRQLLEKQ